jgi:hypothetical protein
MAALVLVSALATVVALVLAGGAYEFVAATQDAQRYPPPGQLIDIGARQLHLNCIGTGTPTVLLEAGGSVLVTSVLHTSLNSYWDTVVPLVMPGSNPLAVVLSLLAGCVSILHSRPA